MIVHECIEIHQNGCVGWIVIMGIKVLLIIYYLIQKILVDVILDIYIKDVKIKSLSIQML
jgi:hypothetical protein